MLRQQFVANAREATTNVLVGDDGNYYFIDTIIFKSDTDGLDTYKKYSPNYSRSK